MTKATMRAARFDRTSRQLTVQDVSIPQPGPGEVLVRVEACGICLSDVHMIDGTFPPPSLEQVTPGHEAAGTIDQVGPSVPLWQAGQRVVLLAGRNCGVCRHCISGNFTDCLNPVVMGQGYDGGWAEYVVVHYSLLTAVPDHVPIEQAALIADAVATPFTGLIDRGRLRLRHPDRKIRDLFDHVRRDGIPPAPGFLRGKPGEARRRVSLPAGQLQDAIPLRNPYPK